MRGSKRTEVVKRPHRTNPQKEDGRQVAPAREKCALLDRGEAYGTTVTTRFLGAARTVTRAAVIFPPEPRIGLEPPQSDRCCQFRLAERYL
jgi:hypothetical protein